MSKSAILHLTLQRSLSPFPALFVSIKLTTILPNRDVTYHLFICSNQNVKLQGSMDLIKKKIYCPIPRVRISACSINVCEMNKWVPHFPSE